MKSKFFNLLIILLGIGSIFFIARDNVYFYNSEAEATSTAESTTIGTAGASELPAQLLIPKLEITSDVQSLGVTSSGNMAAPSNFTDVSWYKFGTIPGYKGSAVMAGHDSNSLGTLGVFKNLHKLEVGDDVYVVDGDGKRLHFKVVRKEIYPYNSAPLEEIFNTSDKARLNLITCTGEWVPEAKTSDKRLVVYTELVV